MTFPPFVLFLIRIAPCSSHCEEVDQTGANIYISKAQGSDAVLREGLWFLKANILQAF